MEARPPLFPNPSSSWPHLHQLLRARRQSARPLHRVLFKHPAIKKVKPLGDPREPPVDPGFYTWLMAGTMDRYRYVQRLLFLLERVARYAIISGQQEGEALPLTNLYMPTPRGQWIKLKLLIRDNRIRIGMIYNNHIPHYHLEDFGFPARSHFFFSHMINTINPKSIYSPYAICLTTPPYRIPHYLSDALASDDSDEEYEQRFNI